MKKILSAAAVMLAAGCGFHLKGTGGISGALPYPSWYIANGQSMQRPLENALRRAGGKPVQASEAQATVTVNHIGTRRDVFTVTRAAVINEYLLVLQVQAQAYAGGRALGEPVTVQVARKIDYSDSEVLGKAEEENTVWEEMRADAAGQIVTRLTFLKAQ
ncbi:MULTISPECIES: LPS assembly lipoprotein LptE [Neisseria]|uniref:LPS-assembly lipoprotein LptE n=1 Tax=Neisseria musculi TaxID=1815583 RepID=A0A7H1MDU4_9NEIS|nr:MULTISPECIES: LPS assembly lipoprotein LptE [Neisseria]MBF0803539.1 hypothetical protein [Neisseria sp. 19428wB4_WF04]QNT59809.1 lipopolysaccharide-assembly family protein [Neisseria musculi]TFU43815.1 hypothetical protein E4T99_04075 [Neisseria sp. WF04]